MSSFCFWDRNFSLFFSFSFSVFSAPAQDSSAKLPVFYVQELWMSCQVIGLDSCQLICSATLLQGKRQANSRTWKGSLQRNKENNCLITTDFSVEDIFILFKIIYIWECKQICLLYFSRKQNEKKKDHLYIFENAMLFQGLLNFA